MMTGRELTDEQRDLAERYHPMACAIGLRFARACGLDRDEAIGVACLALCQAAGDYRAERATAGASAFLVFRVKVRLIEWVRVVRGRRDRPRRRRPVQVSSREFDVSDDGMWASAMQAHVDAREWVERCLATLPPRHAGLIRLCYLEGRPTAEVARMFGLSPSWFFMLQGRAFEAIRSDRRLSP